MSRWEYQGTMGKPPGMLKRLIPVEAIGTIANCVCTPLSLSQWRRRLGTRTHSHHTTEYATPPQRTPFGLDPMVAGLGTRAMDIAPIYSKDNCIFSFPLQWGLTLFWNATQLQAHWLEQLADSLEPDGIRILSHRFFDSTTSQFAISSKPHVSPQTIVQRVKGRLQYLVRNDQPKPFQRNFALRSFGSEQREKIEAYVASQTDHHRCADPDFQAFLESIQIVNPEVDLSKDSRSSHWYNLHVVLVNQERWRIGNEKMLLKIRGSIPVIAKKWNWRISRAGILPDHIHVALGCNIGTFGEYDQRAVRGTAARISG